MSVGNATYSLALETCRARCAQLEAENGHLRSELFRVDQNLKFADNDILSLKAENEHLRAQLSRTPDHAYDKDEWEYTVPWHERDILNDAALNSNGVVRIGTLLDGPDWFIANVPVTFDEDGCPDEREVRWFATREEAEAALAGTDGPE